MFLDIKEYEQIQRGEDVMIVVEAKGEPCMYALLNPYPNKNTNNYLGYENAVFNGERY